MPGWFGKESDWCDARRLETALGSLRGGGAGHDPVSLDENADNVLVIPGVDDEPQQIGLVEQAANTGFFGPAAGAPDYPDFRAAVTADIVGALPFAAPALTLGLANAEGAADTIIRTDATILAFDVTLPEAIVAGGAGAVGVATVTARRDHVHPAPATWPATAHNLLSATHGDTVTNTVARGSLVFGNADGTPAWDELTHPGGAGYAFTTDANDVMWDQTPAWTGLHTFGAGWVLSGGTGDLNGLDLILDTDGDTYLHASADDVVDLVLATASGEFGITINGAEDFTFTANSFNVLTGSYVTMADDTWIGRGAAAGRIIFDSTPNPDQIQLAAADLYLPASHGIIHADGVTANKVLLANGTRFIPGDVTVSIITDLAYGTPALTLGVANAAGAANTVIRTDATILAFDVTVPNIIQPDDAAATGAATVAARRDHEHGIVCAAPAANLSVSTTNTEGTATSFARSDHSHAITSSANPGAAAAILASAADGGLQLLRLGIGADPDVNNRITMVDGGQIGQTSGPLITFDDSNDYLEIMGCDVGIGTATPSWDVHLYRESSARYCAESVADAGAGVLQLMRAYAGPAVVADGATLGLIDAYGYDGVGYQRAGYITFEVDGDPGEDDMPGRIMFYTTPDGEIASSFAMTIRHNQRVGIGDQTPDGQLDVEQSNASGAIPVLELTQADESDGFINFVGSDRGAIAGTTNSVGSVRAEINGTVYRLALYADA